MHMGTTFIVSDSQTGIFGAYGKAIAVAMGFAAITASSVISLVLGTHVYY